MRNKRVVYLVLMFSILVTHTFILNTWLSSENEPAARVNAEVDTQSINPKFNREIKITPSVVMSGKDSLKAILVLNKKGSQ